MKKKEKKNWEKDGWKKKEELFLQKKAKKKKNFKKTILSFIVWSNIVDFSKIFKFIKKNQIFLIEFF